MKLVRRFAPSVGNRNRFPVTRRKWGCFLPDDRNLKKQRYRNLIQERTAMYSVKKNGETAIITLDSSVERGTKEDIDSLKNQCKELQDEGIRNIILNMQHVENAPSIVLGTIIVLQKRLRSAEGEVAILNPTDRLVRILEITKMDKIIGVFKSEEEALGAIGMRGTV